MLLILTLCIVFGGDYYYSLNNMIGISSSQANIFAFDVYLRLGESLCGDVAAADAAPAPDVDDVGRRTILGVPLPLPLPLDVLAAVAVYAGEDGEDEGEDDDKGKDEEKIEDGNENEDEGGGGRVKPGAATAAVRLCTALPMTAGSGRGGAALTMTAGSRGGGRGMVKPAVESNMLSDTAPLPLTLPVPVELD